MCWEFLPTILHGGTMIASKMSVLRPLIESKEGQHLTAYLTNDQNVFHIKGQLREIIDIAYEYLAPVMSPDSLVRFVAPIHNVIEDTHLLINLKGNIGVFRNEDTFRILSLPVNVEQTCVLATSFHVKPLLRWIQDDRDFLFIGINEASASLYQGNRSSFTLVDTIIFSEVLKNSVNLGSNLEKKRNRFNVLRNGELIEWVNEWLFSLTKDSKPPLFLAGSKELTHSFLRESRYQNIRRRPVSLTFSQDNENEICSEIRSILKKDIKKDLEFALMEFYQAEDLNLANKNIFQIAKAAVNGRVKKLIIADGINIFGKIDKKSGDIHIHPTHLDHEDDDILDDLAQEVLAQGGEVIVAAREEIPKGRPILAILEKSVSEMSKPYSNQTNHEQIIERSVV